MMITKTHKSRAGFTLVEIGVVATIAGVLFLTIALTTRTASDTYRSGRLEQDLETQAHRALLSAKTQAKISQRRSRCRRRSGSGQSSYAVRACTVV